jgi:serine/threonine-protein kinase
MATGEHAFPGETVTAVSYKVVHTEPVPPKKLNPAVPAGLDQIILRCLAKAPPDRYATGEDLAHDLSALRAGRSAAELQAPVGTFAASEPDTSLDATLDSHPGAGMAHSQAAKSEKKSAHWAGMTLGTLFAAVIVLGGWYGYTHRESIASIVEPDTTKQPVVVNPDATRGTAKAATPSRPVNREPRKETFTAPPDKSGGPKPSTPVTSLPLPVVLPAPPRVPFDPKQLDPNENAKLKIEADRFPPNTAFTVEMNGKIYFERGGGNNQTAFEDLFVPPAVTEFRVIAGEGANRKTSNIVSAEFKAKKKKTLKIELRTQGQKDAAAGMPAGVYADSQIVVTLK